MHLLQPTRNKREKKRKTKTAERCSSHSRCDGNVPFLFIIISCYRHNLSSNSPEKKSISKLKSTEANRFLFLHAKPDPFFTFLIAITLAPFDFETWELIYVYILFGRQIPFRIQVFLYRNGSVLCTLISLPLQVVCVCVWSLVRTRCRAFTYFILLYVLFFTIAIRSVAI